jgi:hypothetical protein
MYSSLSHSALGEKVAQRLFVICQTDAPTRFPQETARDSQSEALWIGLLGRDVHHAKQFAISDREPEQRRRSIAALEQKCSAPWFGRVSI